MVDWINTLKGSIARKTPLGVNKVYVKAKEFAVKLHQQDHPRSSGRVPPGQTVTQGFPVLDLGIRPEFNPRTFRFRVYGSVSQECLLTYDQVVKLPSKEFTEDFHCVTSWSKFDVTWKGISFSEIIKLVNPLPSWKFLVQEGLDGYTTNVPRADIEKKNVFIAFQLDGKPLPQEHGWPLRLIIPHLYGWKGSKFLTALKFVEKDEPGFWEVRGYHDHGDAFKEERYS
ncbi:MAG: molybdopterin-dependent oxidoreductase [Nanoarchaeota archaeon]|nr:molybdopterin-dependent oxidoreductase [Nanoarchaeota archaeon]